MMQRTEPVVDGVEEGRLLGDVILPVDDQRVDQGFELRVQGVGGVGRSGRRHHVCG